MAEPEPVGEQRPPAAALPEGVTIRPAKPGDARSFLDLWRSVVAEGRSVRSDGIGFVWCHNNFCVSGPSGESVFPVSKK